MEEDAEKYGVLERAVHLVSTGINFGTTAMPSKNCIATSVDSSEVSKKASVVYEEFNSSFSNRGYTTGIIPSID